MTNSNEAMREAVDNPIAAEADDAVRHCISEYALNLLPTGIDPSYAISSIWTGAVAATARFAWQFRHPAATPEQLSETFGQIALSFFQQAEANDAGGVQ